MTTPAVEVIGLTKRIGRKTVVEDVSFEVRPGEVFGLLGPNGAGKTTIIRMMVGLMRMTRGRVRICGFDVTTQFEEAIRHVGAIVENPELYGFLSGYENLRLYARMSPGVTRERIDEVVLQVGLADAIHRRVKTYSLGMRQRLGLAQALLHRPSVLVLDEPSNGLDPAGMRDLRQHLRRLAEEGVAVIVSSHLLSEMEQMCHRVAILQNGRLIRVQSLRRADWDAQDVAVEFEVDPADASAATAVLKEASGLLRTEDEGRAVIVRTKRDRVPDLNARLVSAGVRVYGIRTMERSLEEEFLEATRGTPTARDFERSPDGQVRTSASGIGSTAAEKGDGDAGSDPQ